MFDMIVDKEILSPVVTEIFLKVIISLVLISQSYFKVPKTIRLNATYFVMKIPDKKEL